MLKQVDEPEATPAAEVRITPEELATAIARIESRREENLRHSDGTIAIGAAVKELGLDTSPADVLREVEIQRKTKASGKAKANKRRRGLSLAVCLLLGTAFSGTWLLTHRLQRHLPAPSYSPASFPLSQLPEDEQVCVVTPDLMRIIHKEPALQVQVHRSNQDMIGWLLIKHQGQLYVQAYTNLKTEKEIENHPVDLYNTPALWLGRVDKLVDAQGNLQSAVQVTLPVASFHYEDSEMLDKEARITVSDVQTDSHLWDQ